MTGVTPNETDMYTEVSWKWILDTRKWQADQKSKHQDNYKQQTRKTISATIVDGKKLNHDYLFYLLWLQRLFCTDIKY